MRGFSYQTAPSTSTRVTKTPRNPRRGCHRPFLFDHQQEPSIAAGDTCGVLGPLPRDRFQDLSTFG